jgi:hypothetical protein
MQLERLYLKATGIWFIVVALSITFLYFDETGWAVILWLAHISHQLTLLTLLPLTRAGRNGE